MNKKISSVIFGGTLGIIIFYIASFILGFTAAIPIPIDLVKSFKSNSVLWPFLFLWDTLVVQFVGVGILVAIANYFIVKKSVVLWRHFTVSFIVVEIIFAYSSMSALFSAPILPRNVFFLYLPHFVVVVSCAYIAAYIGSKHKKV